MNQLIITVVGVVLGLVITFGPGFYGGEHIEREKAMHEREKMQQQSMQKLQAAVAKNAALEQQYNTQARTSADEYQAKITDLDYQYRAAGTSRMRIAVTSCRSADAGAAVAESPGKPDAAAVGAVPAQATADLSAVTQQQQQLDLARDADEQRTLLHALQDWIRAVGLY